MSVSERESLLKDPEVLETAKCDIERYLNGDCEVDDLERYSLVWHDECESEYSEFLELASEARLYVTVRFEVLRPRHLSTVVFRHRCVEPVLDRTVRRTVEGHLDVGSALQMTDDPAEPDDLAKYEKFRGLSLVSEQMHVFITELREALLAMRGKKEPLDLPWDPYEVGKWIQKDRSGNTYFAKGQDSDRPGLADLFLYPADGQAVKILRNKNTRSSVETAAKKGWHGNSTKLLVTGESGTGKSLVAHLAHDVLYCDADSQGSRPFEHINCAGLDAKQLQFELFGATPGQYTSVNNPVGQLSRASYGTAFLDEFGDMPASNLPVLLTYLDTLVARPTGITPFFSYTHVVAATNRDLHALERLGKFRGDLVQRFGRRVEIPPLRERGEDEIVTLVDMAAQHPEHNPLESFRGKLGRRVTSISSEAIEMLTKHKYMDGNVRELESIVHRALHSARDRGSAMIEPNDLDIADSASFRPDAERNIVAVKKLPELEIHVDLEDTHDLQRIAERSGRPILKTPSAYGVILDNVLYRYRQDSQSSSIST